MDSPRKIGKYEILERIGQGGFGFVYKGRDPFIKRLVAVKVCTSSDETLRKRFLREAEIAGNLHHRYIVTVFEFGYDDAGPFLIQEYLPGEDLEHKIRRRQPLPQATRLRYLLQIARALDYAHKKGVLHRDVKPGNVRVLEDDRIKILDFGIAKLTGAETQITRTGRILGTAGYLAPEQLEGEPVDARSDVFSFGVLAYELLTYEHPFPGTTISELLDRVVHGEPRPLPTVWPDCPPEVGAMIARCLEKAPGRRYAGFPEIAEVLAKVVGDAEAVERGAEAGTPPAPRPDETLMAPAGRDVRRVGPPREKRTGVEDDLEATQLVEPLPPPGPREVAAKGAPPGATEPAVPPPEEAADAETGGRDEPRPSRPGGLGGLAGRLLLGAVVTLLIVLAAGALWWIARSPETGAAPGGAPAVTAGAGTEASVVVEAVPWGRLVAIEDADGRPVPLPPETTTPMRLHLPAGKYELTLVHPDSDEPATCSIFVEPGAVGRCRVELLRIGAAEYFRKAGWWR